MLHGILNIYKEKGYTSHDVVAKLRGIVGQKKIGHTGTLDPDAEGVLPVCLGRATKVCDLLTEKDKTYRAVLLLGRTTDTQDITGEILGETDTDFLKEEEVEKAVLGFVGEYSQIPPMYSALKVNGRKLYELAREGKNVERKARTVCIREIHILKINLPRVEMEVTCSKGTYIRTLCHDIGEKLGVGGCMESLLRTRVGSFCLENSRTLGEIQKAMEEGSLLQNLIPIDAVFGQYRRVQTEARQEKLLYNGNALCIKDERDVPADKELVRVYDSRGEFVAIYQYLAGLNQYRIVKMFFNGRKTEE
ncbi:tRNA pseudouridine(55) synthase TruB [Faecalimonas umbilicata]|nr:tRNA pseudouridine(55) synthase TruB [Faecalimonas umbilicata]